MKEGLLRSLIRHPTEEVEVYYVVELEVDLRPIPASNVEYCVLISEALNLRLEGAIKGVLKPATSGRRSVVVGS